MMAAAHRPTGSQLGRPTSLYLVRRHQSTLSAYARMIFQLRRADHFTDALASLHWLCVPERIQFKITVLVCTQFFMALHRETESAKSYVRFPGQRIVSDMQALVVCVCVRACVCV